MSIIHETGVSNVVLYYDNVATPWDGVVSIVEDSPDELRTAYVDGEARSQSKRPQAFSGSIAAYTIPALLREELERGYSVLNQTRLVDFSYETNTEIHVVYNAIFYDNDFNYETLSDDVSPDVPSFSFTTIPLQVPGGRPSAHFIVDKSLTYPSAIQELIDTLRGTSTKDANLPGVTDLIAIFERNALFRIVDNMDGTWTATGPSSMISVTGDLFTITSPTAMYISNDTYTISSY